MVGAVVGGKIIKDKIYQVAQVGELKQSIKKNLKIIDVEPKASSIAVYQNTILHITRDSKPKGKEPNIDEIKAVIGVFDEAKRVFYDKKDNVLLYFYNSLQNDNMVNYAVVRLDYTLKKFKTDNFIATITRIPVENYKAILKDKKRYIRIK